MQTLWAVVHDGKIELAESVDLPEGARALVTLLSDDENRFWIESSQKSLAAICDNAEDDAYAQLVEE